MAGVSPLAGHSLFSPWNEDTPSGVPTIHWRAWRKQPSLVRTKTVVRYKFFQFCFTFFFPLEWKRCPLSEQLCLPWRVTACQLSPLHAACAPLQTRAGTCPRESPSVSGHIAHLGPMILFLSLLSVPKSDLKTEVCCGKHRLG